MKDSKYCPRCDQTKSVDNFYKKTNPKRPHILYRDYCKGCQKKDYQLNKEKLREKAIFRTYGITIDDYDKLRIEQEFRCKICGTHESISSGKGLLHIDHCHETGVIRGLLCGKCNIGLGHFNDKASLFRKALNYLEGGQ